MTETFWEFVVGAIPSQPPLNLVLIRGRHSEGAKHNHNNSIFQPHLHTDRHTIWAKHVLLLSSFPSSPHCPYSVATHLLSLSFSPCTIFRLLSSCCLFLGHAVLSLPHLLSPRHAWWFDIANWCQTTKPYFPSAVLSLPLSVSPLSRPSLLLYSLICSGGLVARLQDFHITSFSLPEDLLLFAAVLLWPSLSKVLLKSYLLI